MLVYCPPSNAGFFLHVFFEAPLETTSQCFIGTESYPEVAL